MQAGRNEYFFINGKQEFWQWRLKQFCFGFHRTPLKVLIDTFQCKYKYKKFFSMWVVLKALHFWSKYLYLFYLRIELFFVLPPSTTVCCPYTLSFSPLSSLGTACEFTGWNLHLCLCAYLLISQLLDILGSQRTLKYLGNKIYFFK